MVRPFHVLTVTGTAAHHVFELAAGVGLIFAPQLGMRRAALFWGSVLPAAGLAAARGSERWAPALAYAAGTSAAMDVLHFQIWPWKLRRGIPTLTEAEGLTGRPLAAYNALLQAWAVAASAALALETPARARKWAALGGLGAAVIGPVSVRHHFTWLGEQARTNPAWWNRAAAADG